MSAGTFLKSLTGRRDDLGEIGAQAVTLRYATPDDAQALERLAATDSSRAPRGIVVVAEVDDELWAATSLDDGHAVADPFRPSGEVAALLAARARQLHRAEKGRMGLLPRVWPAIGDERLGLTG